IVVAVGDFDPAVIEAQIKESLSPVKARAPARARPDLGKVAPPAQATAKLYHQPEAGSVSVSFDYVLPYKDKQDSAEARVKDLRTNLAIGMLNRRFGLLARKE